MCLPAKPKTLGKSWKVEVINVLSFKNTCVLWSDWSEVQEGKHFSSFWKCKQKCDKCKKGYSILFNEFGLKESHALNHRFSGNLDHKCFLILILTTRMHLGRGVFSTSCRCFRSCHLCRDNIQNEKKKWRIFHLFLVWTVSPLCSK